MSHLHLPHLPHLRQTNHKRGKLAEVRAKGFEEFAIRVNIAQVSFIIKDLGEVLVITTDNLRRSVGMPFPGTTQTAMVGWYSLAD